MSEKLNNAGCELGYLVELLRDESFCDSCRAEMLLKLADRAAAGGAGRWGAGGGGTAAAITNNATCSRSSCFVCAAVYAGALPQTPRLRGERQRG